MMRMTKHAGPVISGIFKETAAALPPFGDDDGISTQQGPPALTGRAPRPAEGFREQQNEQGMLHMP
jgi:hypothetical protein